MFWRNKYGLLKLLIACKIKYIGIKDLFGNNKIYEHGNVLCCYQKMDHSQRVIEINGL